MNLELEQAQVGVDAPAISTSISRYREALREAVAMGITSKPMALREVRKALARARVAMRGKQYSDAAVDFRLAADLLDVITGM